MAVPILVVTPHPAFGELLRLSLEESGQYSVRLVRTGEEARASAAHARFTLAILDFDMTDEPCIQVTQFLRSQFPQMRLIVIPPENNPQHPLLAQIAPDGFLGRPFYLPDLLEMVEHLVGSSKPAPVSPPVNVTLNPEQLWAKDPVETRRVLTSLLTSSDALALFINRARQYWADSGKLEPASIQEVAAILGRYWDIHGNTDLVRFIRLADNSDYLLYGTSLTGEWALGLLYETNIPLLTCRNQSNKLATTLMNLPLPGAVAVEPPPIPKAAPPQPVVQPPPAPVQKVEVPQPVSLPPSTPIQEEVAPQSVSPPPSTPIQEKAAPQPVSQPPQQVAAQDAEPLDEEGEDESEPSLSEETGEGEFNLEELQSFFTSLPPPDPNSANNELPPAWMHEENPNAIPEYKFPWEEEDRFKTPEPAPQEPLPEWLSASAEVKPPTQPAADEPLPAWLETAQTPVASTLPAETEPQPATPPQDLPPWLETAQTPTAPALPAEPEPQPATPPQDLPPWLETEQTPAAPALPAEPEPQPASPPQDLPAWLFVEEAALEARKVQEARNISSQKARSSIEDTQPRRVTQPPTPAQTLAVPTPKPAPARSPVPESVSEPIPAPLSSTPIEKLTPDSPAPTTDPILSIWLQTSSQTPETTPPVPKVEETRSTRTTKPLAPQQILQPLSIFTCLLIPQNPAHFLVGKIVDDLNIWMAQIHMRNQWQCRNFAVRPQYLHWTTQAPPGFTGEKIAEDIRLETSRLILEHYPNLRNDASSCFWTAQPMILRGMHTPTPSMINDLIQKSRGLQPKP